MVDVLFPVQVRARELDYRVALACSGLPTGTRVHVGQKDVVHRLAQVLPGGVYLGRDLIPTRGADRELGPFRAAKARGFRVVHFDEEGAVFYGREDNWRRTLQQRLPAGVLTDDDRICAWGDFQRDVYRDAYPSLKEHIQTTGHPRFDLYKPRLRGYFDDDVRRLRARHGEFLLWNTSFVLSNHANGPGHELARRARGKNEEERARLFGEWSHVARTLPRFVELVVRVARERPDVPIVIRPHPSEDAAFYERAFAGAPNVSVTREGAVTPWLLACRALLHHGCTTAIEAHFAGVPTINYRPQRSPVGEKPLPALFGRTVETEDDAFAALFSDAAAPSRDAPPEARELLANLEHNAFALVRRQLEAAAPTNRSARRAHAAVRVLNAAEHVQRAAWKIAPSRALAYHASKFSPLVGDELEARVARACRLFGTDVRVRVAGPWLATLEVR